MTLLQIIFICLVKNIKKKFILAIKKDFRIQLKNINDQNFVGCSNTTLKSKSLLNIINDINIKLIGFDWCIAKLLILNNFKGLLY